MVPAFIKDFVYHILSLDKEKRVQKEKNLLNYPSKLDLNSPMIANKQVWFLKLKCKYNKNLHGGDHCHVTTYTKFSWAVIFILINLMDAFLPREHVLLLSWKKFLTMGSGYDTDNHERDMEPVIMVLMLKGTTTFHRYRHM